MSEAISTHNMPVYAPMPRIGEAAPDFAAASTHGELHLSDFSGNWLVFFSHPADFTPVCASEFVSFSKHAADFKALDANLLALSVDSVMAHIAWLEQIADITGEVIDFPVIADGERKIAKLYGMLHEGESSTETVRACFIIDPKGIIRAIQYYPMMAGRNVPEILRLLEALQIGDKHQRATPADWQPGDEVILPPPQELGLARARKARAAANQKIEGKSDQPVRLHDWWYATAACPPTLGAKKADTKKTASKK